MTSKPLNFDVENYTINDLTEIFELPLNYDTNMIEIKETKLREKLLNNVKLTPKLKEETIKFIKVAKIKLQQNIKPTSSKMMISTNPYHIEKPITTPNNNEIETLSYKHFLNIDTRFRDNLNQTSSNFDTMLPFKLSNVTSMTLESIELPITFYAVSSTSENNYFDIEIRAKEKDKNQTHNYKARFILKDGNYKKTSLINELTTVDNYHDIYDTFKNFYQDVNYDNVTFNIFQYINFAIDIDNEGSGTGKIKFSFNMEDSSEYYDVEEIKLYFNSTFHCTPDNKDIFKRLGWLLGFRKEQYTSDNSANSFEIKGDGLVDIRGPRYLFLVIDDHNSNSGSKSNFFSGFNKISLNKNILARIPLSTNSFSYEISNVLNIVSKPREYSKPISIERLSIQFIDEYSRIVNFNDMNVSLCLSFILNSE